MQNNRKPSRFSSSQRGYRDPEYWEAVCPFELTDEEMAILLDEEIEREPTEEELRMLVPGYKQRILAGVLARISE